MLSWHGGFLSIELYHHQIKLTHYDKAKERAPDSQIVRAKENLKLSQGEIPFDLHSWRNKK